jgi:hypothetical protein
MTAVAFPHRIVADTVHVPADVATTFHEVAPI